MAIFSIDSHELSYLVIDDVHTKEPIFFLHGIMGNKKNLVGFVTKLLAHTPMYSGIIVDLPNHGMSSKHWLPLSVQTCAHAAAQLGNSVKPRIIAGHSFGGKVALLAAELMPSIEHVIMLDCPLSAVGHVKPLNPPQSQNALEVMAVLETIAFPVTSRKELVTSLTQQGVEKALAMWMTTNLIESHEGLHLNFDPHDTRVMLHDFMELDCWPVLARMRDRIFLHAVAAEYGQRVLGEKERFLETVSERGTFNVLNDAGHFVHVDNPNGLIEIIKKFLVF